MQPTQVRLNLGVWLKVVLLVQRKQRAQVQLLGPHCNPITLRWINHLNSRVNMTN